MMENFTSYVYEKFSSLSSSVGLQFICILLFGYLLWYLYTRIHPALSSQSSIHYVNLERKALYMSSSYNPFSCKVSLTRASYSGITCTLESEQSCYVQAFWRVPISSLFELLGSNWQSLIRSVASEIPERKFRSKCVCANEAFILSAGEEKTLEFQPYWNIWEDASKEETCLRTVYPFVLLMVLKEDVVVSKSQVVAMATAVHVPDTSLLLYPQLIGQYVTLFTGQVGQMKKIFLSSPATSDDDEGGYSLCLACYHRPVSMVYLPCRHACLCNVCFDMCKKCPVCRATSMYYFELCDIPEREAHH